MIRVIQVISDTNIGGGGRSLLNYLACCDRTRFSPSVVLPRGSALTERVRALDVPVEEIDAMADQSLDWKAVPPLVRIFRRAYAITSLPGSVCDSSFHRAIF